VSLQIYEIEEPVQPLIISPSQLHPHPQQVNAPSPPALNYGVEGELTPKIIVPGQLTPYPQHATPSPSAPIYDVEELVQSHIIVPTQHPASGYMEELRRRQLLEVPENNNSYSHSDSGSYSSEAENRSQGCSPPQALSPPPAQKLFACLFCRKRHLACIGDGPCA
jgi:hypothetical protein